MRTGNKGPGYSLYEKVIISALLVFFWGCWLCFLLFPGFSKILLLVNQLFIKERAVTELVAALF